LLYLSLHSSDRMTAIISADLDLEQFLYNFISACVRRTVCF
jgi:hypothetical protein